MMLLCFEIERLHELRRCGDFLAEFALYLITYGCCMEAYNDNM